MKRIYLFPSILLLAGLLVSGPGADAAFGADLSVENHRALEQAGLGPDGLKAYLDLLDQPGRRRAVPAVPDITGLLVSGFDEEAVILFLEMERASGHLVRAPLTVRELTLLKNRGVKPETLKALMVQEIVAAGRNEPSGAERPLHLEPVTPPEKAPVSEKPPAPGKQAVPETPKAVETGPSPGSNLASGQPEPSGPQTSPGVVTSPPQKPILGREIVTQPDGRKVIIYRSGRHINPVEEVTTDEDGRKQLIYRVGDPDRPDPAEEKRKREELEHALLLLRALRE
jgi:hypothetical protein